MAVMSDDHGNTVPIAVVGIGCRFPGDITSSEKLWNFLVAKKSAQSTVPPDRYNVDAFYHPDPDHYGTVIDMTKEHDIYAEIWQTNTRGGHYLTEDVSLFDAPFFSISPAEAMAMDPMQRILLEVAYEALENSGVTLEKISGTRTSCFVGCFTKDYEEMQRRDMELAPKYQSTGASQTMLSNRLSYFFNLKGPSVSLDTACSSGLVAVHLACQSLQLGESSTAIVGGSNLILSPDLHIEMSDMHFLGSDSISYAFDERANGYARGEGVGVLVLKPLSDALRDNDAIRAVIRGTAASSDGRTPGITMPSRKAQVELMKSAYRAAGCGFGQTGYFEAHGTGTAAGDPIETGAIGEVFAPHRPLALNGEPIPLSIGSLKTNIGHLEGASGIAGLIKAVLAVETGVIPPNLWFQKGNTNIDFEAWRIHVPTQPSSWPIEGVRRASVNSFGYGGTNAHVVVEEASGYTGRSLYSSKANPNLSDSGFVTPTDDVSESADSRARVFLLSAHDSRGLSVMGSLLHNYLEIQPKDNQELLLDRLAHTLSHHRTRHSHRQAIVATERSELCKALEMPGSTTGRTDSTPSLAWLFTGQGASWAGMGRELFRYPVFRSSMRNCETHIRDLCPDWSLTEELLREGAESRVNEASISQPLCTALQIALVDLLESWNVRPSYVIGHSSGEIAAAYAVGALTADAAMKVAFFRGMLAPKVKALGYQGRMMAVSLSEDEAIQEIAQLDDQSGQAVVACINSPRGVTISGEKTAVEKLYQALIVKGIFAKILPGIEVAYHSHHMQAIAHEYLDKLLEAQISARVSKEHVPMFSSVIEGEIEHSQLGAEYWVANLTGCVRFAGALQKLCQKGVDVLLEIGPHALFKLPVHEMLEHTFGDKSHIQYVPMLLRNQKADLTALEAAGKLAAYNVAIDLSAINFPTEPHTTWQILTDLPQYPWNHSRGYWYESRSSRDYRFRPSPRTEILGARVHDYWNPSEPRFRNFFRLREQPWLRDHIVQGDVLFPACGYLCMAIEACRQLLPLLWPKLTGGDLEYRLREVNIARALIVPETDEGIETSLSLRPQWESNATMSKVWHEFHICSYTTGNGWVENCRGLVAVDQRSVNYQNLTAACHNDWAEARTSSSHTMAPATFYKEVDAMGLTYGPLFQGLKDVTIDARTPNRATGIIKVTDTASENPKGYEHPRLIHPATLDSFLQLALAALGGTGLEKLNSAMVPIYVEEIAISANVQAQIGDHINVLADARPEHRKARADIIALDADCNPVVVMDGFRFVAINAPNALLHPNLSGSKQCYRAKWEPDVDMINSPNLSRELRTAHKLGDRPKSVRELEFLAYYFIDLALQEIPESEAGNMLPHHQEFYRNLCELQATIYNGKHPQQTEEWQMIRDVEVNTKLSELAEYYRNHDTAHDGKLLVRVGESLPAIFRQKIEPLALMTHENLLEDYYTTAVGMPNTYAQIERFMQILSHKNPNLDFLEIGAGTGGTTVPTLRGLSGYEGFTNCSKRLKSYTYTDISSYFFQRAKEKFEDFAEFMTFKKLDIENDPDTQGLSATGYDVVVAANVLHATSDMYRTLSNVRKLLRPGGRLVLLEMTNRLLAASVIFGTLPGWWNASEEWRTGGPLLTEDQWRALLLATGFSDLQCSSPDVSDPLEEGTRLMITMAVEQKSSLSSSITGLPNKHRVLIIYAEPALKMTRSNEAIALARKLIDSGRNAELVPFNMIYQKNMADAVCISLIEFEDSLLATMSSAELSSFQRIMEEPAGLIWATRGSASSDIDRPDLSLFQGLSRTIRAEHEGFHCASIDFDDKRKLAASEVANVLHLVYEEYIVKAQEGLQRADSEFIERSGVLHIQRAIEDTDSNNFLVARTDPLVLSPKIETISAGKHRLSLKLSDVKINDGSVWEEDMSAPTPLKPTEVKIHVQASVLDPEDIEILNNGGSNHRPGKECSGIVDSIGSNVGHLSVGDRVTCWSRDTFTTSLRTQAAFVHKIPDEMSFETAATLPLAYSTAYYSLVYIARIAKGETVLIHEATAPVGLAALHIASTVAANIFVSVGSMSDKASITEHFGLDDSHVFSSQDIDVVGTIRQLTKGNGLDIILNTQTGEGLQATFSCIAPFGRFIDLARSNASENARLEMAPFGKNVSFTSVHMARLYDQRNRLAGNMFQEGMKFLADQKLATHAVINTMPWSKLDKAIEVVQDQKQGNRMVMTYTQTDTVQVTRQPPPPVTLDPSASYLLAGGLGGLGRSIACWLVDSGARHLIFLSRSGASSASASSLIAAMEAAGTQTRVVQCDIADSTSVKTVLCDTLKDFPPIKGVIQGAMALSDSLFQNMDSDKWMNCIRPKVFGSKNLHEATLDQPLDFFILLSSLHSFIGNPGQSNYAAGCAYQVALASYRNSLDLPAVAIDLGIVGDIGYVMENQSEGKKVMVQDFKHLSEREMLALIELGIREPRTGHVITGLDSELDMTTSMENAPFFARDPVLSHLDYLRPHLQHTSARPKTGNEPTSTASVSLSAQILAATSPEHKEEVVQIALIRKLSRSLMMEPEEIDPGKSMSAYGTDSLVAVELKNWVQRETKVSISVFDILQSNSIGELVRKIADRLAEKS
ncbi:polyketide synthase-like protein [Phaeosphaeria sp. MPI-PUGE-AT-0046c]|nr:polyketide synthase-like protein [Phaeosphaeria sp. MPI-PUGE-AT-0046c]